MIILQQKTPLCLGSGVLRRCRFSNLARRSLGCLQRIDFLLGGGKGRCHMGRKVTISVFPFQLGLGASTAVPTVVQLGSTITPLASFNNFMAQAVIVATAFGGHEGTFTALSNGLTNHGYHSPFELCEHKKMARFMPHPAIFIFSSARL
jgi:hypothetical protein